MMAPTTQPLAECLHDIPGRVRARVASIEGDRALARSLAAKLRSIEGVKDVAASPLTGTLLVHYDPKAVDRALVLRAMGCPPAEVAQPRAPRPLAGRGRGGGGGNARTMRWVVAGFLAHQIVEFAAAGIVLALL